LVIAPSHPRKEPDDRIAQTIVEVDRENQGEYAGLDVDV
jgi:hypothetical protein